MNLTFWSIPICETAAPFLLEDIDIDDKNSIRAVRCLRTINKQRLWIF